MEFVDQSMKLIGLISPKLLSKFKISAESLAPLKSYKEKETSVQVAAKRRKRRILKLPKIESVLKINESVA